MRVWNYEDGEGRAEWWGGRSTSLCFGVPGGFAPPRLLLANAPFEHLAGPRRLPSHA